MKPKKNDTDMMNKMKKIRELYGLNKIDMSRICGFGANTWRRYEAGKSEPTGSNKKLIKQTFRPSTMLKLLELVSEENREIMGRRWSRAHANAKRYVEQIERKTTEYRNKLINNFIVE